MIGDKENLFCENQAITASAASTNYIDLGPLFSGNTYRDIGAGRNMWLVITVTEAFTDGGSDSTVTPKWETDSDSAFGSAVTIRTFDTLAALTAAGTVKKYKLEPGAYEQYNRLYFTVANGNLTTGKFTAELVVDVPSRRDYASGFGSSV